MVTEMKIPGEDIAIEKLVPLNTRNINLNSNCGYHKIVASIKAIGLIEPLCVYKEGDRYVILDGFLRFKACEELGIETIPCILFDNKEAYTFNRMVNRLSPFQEHRMLRESLKTVDQSTIAEVFGIQSIKYRLGTAIFKQLHHRLIKAVDTNVLSKKCAMALTYVLPERQLQILKEMERTKDYSISFTRALVIKTPPTLRNRTSRTRKLWLEDSGRKQELVSKLESVQERYDFYSNLYRQYSMDLLKVCVYVRKLVTNERLRSYLELKYPDILEHFENIVFETEGKKAG